MNIDGSDPWYFRPHRLEYPTRMIFIAKTTHVPGMPTLLWDGNCEFCARWIGRLQKITGNAVVYCPYQDCLAQFPQLHAADCAAAVQLVLPDGRQFAAAHAVLQTLAIAGHATGWLALYQKSRIFRCLAEAAYRAAAASRSC